MKKLATSTFLSHDEMADMTGYRRPSRMREILIQMGIKFFIAADGYPRVPRTVLENQQVRQPQKPNLAGLKKSV